jgi:GT2 family glycosyltransferase
MSTPKITIIIVTWNSMRYLFDCLESLMHQTFRDFSVLVIDNGSKDNTVEFIRSYYPTAAVLQNFKNVGFSKAYNQGIKMSKSEYVLVLNHDVILNENFLSELILFANSHPQAGSFGGKVLKLYSQDVDPVNGGGGLRSAVKSDIIDSTGLVIYKNRQVVDRGEGEKDEGQYNRTEQVFGISGACVMYRRQALEDVKIKDEYFDNSFFAYKEDIDLAWRLRLYGWESWYISTAVVYHHRHFSGLDGKKATKIISERRQISRFLRSLSFRNHHLMLVKNEIAINFFYHLFPICWREAKLIIYSLIFEPFLFRSAVKLFRQLPFTLIKRRVIMGHRKASAKEMRRWFR